MMLAFELLLHCLVRLHVAAKLRVAMESRGSRQRRLPFGRKEYATVWDSVPPGARKEVVTLWARTVLP